MIEQTSDVTPANNESAQVYIRPSGVSKGAKDPKQLSEALAKLGPAIRGPFTEFVAKLATTEQGIASGPSEIEVKFGLVFEGGSDWIVVSFSAEASLDVTLKWKRQ